MKTDDFYQLMEKPSELTEDTLPVLKEVVDEYPWFQAAHLLYLKNLAQVEDIRFPAELRKMALFVPDRKKLFLLIEGEKYGLYLPVMARGQQQNEEEQDNTFSLIDSFLSSYEKEKEPEESLLLNSSVSSDYIYWAMTHESEEPEKEPEIPLQHQKLIDNFIREEEERPVGTTRINLDEMPEGSQVPESIQELDELDENEVNGSYFTETLARIYVKQKRYDKALQIIKNLSLNYPEKSIYFADQIRFLEKLIINTKK